MKFTNAKIFLGKEFVRGGIEFDEEILVAGPEAGVGGLDLEGAYVIPGLVDIHSHAAVGGDASDGDPEALYPMGRFYAAGGVTSWCPTTMTLKEPELTKAVKAIRTYQRPADGAKMAGINLEGPFLSMSKKGAQNPENLHAPDADMFFRLQEASGNRVCLVTVAPEEPGAIPFIEQVSGTCRVSIGHTAADYDQACAAFRAGASHATHLFNGMPGLHHRMPGVIAAASDWGATVELITDGIHIHPSVIRLTHRLFGDKLCLISDSLRCTGMPDGEYDLGGQSVTMKNGKATLTGTDTLAGSSIHLMEGLRRSVHFGIPLESAVYAATAAPAQVIGKFDRIGSIAPGKCADFVILNQELQVQQVFIDGKRIR